jgi:hypothetical protein
MAQILVKFLVNKYNIRDVEKSLGSNTVFPIQICPFYEGKAKKFLEIIQLFKSKLEDLRKTNESPNPNLIKAIENYINKTEEEFNKLKIYHTKRTIENALIKLLDNIKIEYIQLIHSFINQWGDETPNLGDLCNLIANAIINS